MKKWDIVCIVMEALLTIGALMDVIDGSADVKDYSQVGLCAFLLVGTIVYQIFREIEIQKKLKQMREEEKKKAESQNEGITK